MSGNILVITSSYDLTVDYIINRYKQEYNFFRINTDHLSHYEIKVQNKSNFWIIKNTVCEINSNDICAIYYRKPVLPDLSAYESKYHRLMYKEILTFIEGIVESFPKKCLSKPSILKRADNKIMQLKLASEIGFRMPSSIITNSGNFALDFIKQNENTIVKPLSIGKIIYKDNIDIIQTNLVNKDLELKNLEMSPAYFQEYIDKKYELRVTIVDDKVFAVKIETAERIDWRKNKEKIQYSKYILPTKIEKMCFELMESLNLKYGAFDFIVNNKDEFYFLEINANGQWGWLEKELKLGISESIINYLKSVIRQIKWDRWDNFIRGDFQLDYS